MAKKYFKKALSMGLALTMCLSLAAPAFAEDVPENPYQEQINTANKVKEDADEAKKDSNIYWSAVDQQLEIAGGKNADATDKSSEVEETVEKVEGDVSKVVTDQQALADAAEKAANGQITDAASTITGETEKVSAAVDEANKAVEGVNEKLEALKDETLTPEQKVEAAQEAQAAADTAVQAAADAAKVVETAQETVDAAVKAAEDAKAAYDAAVQAAQKAVGDAKAAALAELEEAKATLEAAKTDLADATAAKETAERAKKNADGALETAQAMLQAAQEAYNGEWPESDIVKDNVTQGAINDKKHDANRNEMDAKAANKLATDLGVEISGLNKEVISTTETKTETESTCNTKKTEKNWLTEAMDEYNDAMGDAKKVYDGSIDAAKAEYKRESERLAAENKLSVLGGGDWSQSYAALELSPGKYGDPICYNGTPIKNSEFAYYLEVSKQYDGEDSEIYQQLKSQYEQWRDVDTNPDREGKKEFNDAIKLCERAVKSLVDDMQTASNNRKKAEDTAEENLLADKRVTSVTGCDTVTDVTEKIGELGREITRLEGEIEVLGDRIDTLNSQIGEKEVEKLAKESLAKEKAAAAETARRAAQKLTDLLALKEALAAAEAALYQAQEAQAAAAERQAEAQKKLEAYKDAQDAVNAAEEALTAKLSGDLESGKLSLTAGADFDADLAELEAKLKAAQDAAKEAEENYNKAKEDADKAKEDAENAKKDADEAKEDADRELEDFNNSYAGGDTGGADDADAPDDTGVEIDDESIPLSNGPVTRAQFVDYLWRHEGSPAAESELFADHEYAPAIAWALSVEIIGEDFQPDELATVADVRAILGSFARVFGSNAVDAADLTTLAGEDGEAVMNCAQVLAEFFGEEYDIPEDLDNLEIDDAA